MQVNKFNPVTGLQIIHSNVTHPNFYFECNAERGPIDQLYNWGKNINTDLQQFTVTSRLQHFKVYCK